MSDISQNIKNFRLYHGISQRALADKIGKSSGVVCNWEKGTNKPDLDSIEKLCQILECTPNELLGWDENEDVQNFLKKKQYILNEVQKLTKAREVLDKQIADYYKQIEDSHIEIDLSNVPDGIDLDSIDNVLKRRIKFIDSSENS